MRQRDDAGATTAEYAVGTVAAAGFGGSLLLLAPAYFQVVRHLLEFMLGNVVPAMPW